MPIDSCLCCSALFMLFEKRCADATSVFSDYQLRLTYRNKIKDIKLSEDFETDALVCEDLILCDLPF